MRRDKQTQQTLKTILFSTLVSINIVIWYSLIGDKFALAVTIISLFVIFLQ